MILWKQRRSVGGAVQRLVSQSQDGAAVMNLAENR
jgi:hypothetical protein